MSIRYINSNDLINDVPDYLQNIINNMDCVYIDGIKPNNQHFNLEEHDKQIREDVIKDFAKWFDEEYKIYQLSWGAYCEVKISATLKRYKKYLKEQKK